MVGGRNLKASGNLKTIITRNVSEEPAELPLAYASGWHNAGLPLALAGKIVDLHHKASEPGSHPKRRTTESCVLCQIGEIRWLTLSCPL
jgi:hypothetical protein